MHISYYASMFSNGGKISVVLACEWTAIHVNTCHGFSAISLIVLVIPIAHLVSCLYMSCLYWKTPLKNTKVFLGLNIMTRWQLYCIGHSTLDFALDKLFCYYDAFTGFSICQVNGVIFVVAGHCQLVMF